MKDYKQQTPEGVAATAKSSPPPQKRITSKLKQNNMSDKWFMNDKESTAKGLLYTRIGVGVIAALFLIFGLFVKSVDPTHLYSALHPASLWNILGVVLFLVFLSYIAGVFVEIIEAIGIPEGSTWPNYAGFAAGALGVALMYA